MSSSPPPNTPQRKLSAILIADVHEYSRLMGQNEEETCTRVERSIALFKSLIGDYGGNVINVAGDGILSAFESASQALSFAVDIQREFQNDAVWNADGEQIVFRIGINLGEIFFGEATVHGHNVNIAARMQKIASPGGICISDAVRRTAGDTLGVHIRPMGRQRFKNIREPIEVFAIEVDEPDATATEVRTPHNPAIEPLIEASIAVMPLENLSDDPRNDHLCEGLTGDIISNLTRFRDLLVIAQHSVNQVKNLSISWPEVGAQLGVRYLLTGSLRRSGSKIRIYVQLITADSGNVIWSERYDGDLSDVFDFQDEVTNSITANLAVQIRSAERRRILQLNAPDLHAYGLILRGQHLSFQFNKNANLHARRLFEQAATIDPSYGRSYASMSRTFNLEWRYAWTRSPEDSLEKAMELAAAAIDYDSVDARGYAELGYAHLYKKQHEASLAAYERAMDLNPNDADIMAEYADALVYDGQPEKSIRLFKQAMRLNPYYPDWYLWYLADAYNAMARPEDVIATVDKMHNPAEGRRLLAASYAHLGLLDEAKAQAELVLKLHPGFTIKHWAQRPPYKDQDILERYMDDLRKAGLPEN